MEFLLDFGLFIVVAISVLVYLAWLIPKGTSLPPGPPNWPIVGSLFYLSKSLHRSMEELAKKYGPIMYLRLGYLNYIVISNAEMAFTVLKIHDADFAFRPLSIIGKYVGFEYSNIIFSPYGDKWRLLRKICATELLTRAKLKTFEPTHQEEVACMFATVAPALAERKPTNMRTRLFDTSMNMMTRLLFGKRYFGLKISNKKNDEFKDTILKQLAIIGILNIGDFVPLLRPFDLQGIIRQSKQLRLKVDQIFDEMIQDRLKQNGLNDSKDFLGAMLSLPKTHGFGDRLGDNTIKAVLNGVMQAGTDTIAITTEWALAELLRHPQFAKKAREELDDVVGLERVVNESDIPQLKYLLAIVKETFRLHPPVPLLLPRENIKGCEVGGYHIPPKTRLYVNAWAIHRDPSIYENPLEFNPERFVGSNVDLKGKDFELLPFGSGRRVCPGFPFGFIAVQLELARFLHGFTLSLPKGENLQDMDMTEVFSITAPKAISLHVV
ncbi:unnamed protein product, partial [Sphagnum tenellum]